MVPGTYPLVGKPVKAIEFHAVPLVIAEPLWHDVQFPLPGSPALAAGGLLVVVKTVIENKQMANKLILR